MTPEFYHNAEAIAGFYRPGARPEGGWFKIPCPAHGGTDNNLHLGDAPDGGLVIKCWSAGCTFNDILRAFQVDGPSRQAGQGGQVMEQKETPAALPPPGQTLGESQQRTTTDSPHYNPENKGAWDTQLPNPHLVVQLDPPAAPEHPLPVPDNTIKTLFNWAMDLDHPGCPDGATDRHTSCGVGRRYRMQGQYPYPGPRSSP